MRVSVHLLLALFAPVSIAQVGQLAAATPADGRSLFERHCALCHGIDASGGRGPSLRRPHLSRAPNENALRAVISDGIPPDMPDGWFLSPDDVVNLATYVRSLSALPPQPVPGNPKHGAKVYANSRCSTCHILAGNGRAYGTELTNIGERRSASFIREVILNPTSALDKGAGGWTIDSDSILPFMLVKAITVSGETIRGIRVNEDSFTIQIRDSADRFHSVRKEDLKELRKLRDATPMPSSKGLLTQTELQDLVAYLVAQEGQP